jgi:lipopolysaccharide biosynthesis glycosyltransferase
METINIAFASDNGYAQPMGVAIYSLLDNFHSVEYKIKVTILDGGILEENKKKIVEIGERFSTEIEFKKISNEIFKDCKNVGRYTLVTYYSLINPSVFGNEVKKAIHLDCDILVIGNIAELYKKNINGYLVAAVQARFVDKKYFTNGVLLMNLEKMRKENFTKRAFDFIKENDGKLNYFDQDVWNSICKDQWLELSNIWNFEIERSERKIIPEPIILHYATSYKPWHRFYHNYYQKEYLKYLKKWPDYKIWKIDSTVAIKQLIKYIPFSISIVRFVKRKIQKATTKDARS